MFAFYAFAKLLDETGDSRTYPQPSVSPPSQELQQRRFETFRAIASGDRWSSCAGLDDLLMIQPALHAAAQEYGITSDLLLDMIDGVQSDCKDEVRMADVAALDRYCYQVAGTVGLGCLAIWGASISSDDAAFTAALRCGEAFQRTNILRDVAEDAACNRIYIPSSKLNEFQCDSDAWLAKSKPTNWLEFVEDWFLETELKYEQSWQLCALLPIDGQKMFSLMWRTYRAVLLELRSQADRIWEQRLALSRSTKMMLALQHFFTPLYSQLPPPICTRSLGSSDS